MSANQAVKPSEAAENITEEPDEKPLQEKPLYPGAPPPQPAKPLPQILLYMLAATFIGLTQGLGMTFITVSLQQVAGPMKATTAEATWLLAVYMVPNASLTLMLFKMRQQFGIRRFAEVSIVIYVLVNLCHFWTDSYQAELVVRFFAGVAAAPMSSIAILYMLEGLPREKKLSIGICAVMTVISLAMPVAGLIAPILLNNGGLQRIYMFEIGLAMASLALIFKLPLRSGERVKVISRNDLIAFFFLFIGMGALVVALTVGRVYWWLEKPWIGWLMVVGVASLTIMVLIEVHRENPLLDIRWITSAEILHFTGALLIFRIILSEQSSGARAFFMMLGFRNEQLQSLYIVIILATITAGATCSFLLKPGRVAALHGFALVLLIIGTWLDSHATSLTRPPQMYLSQTMVAFAAGLFLPPAMMVGMIAAIRRGPNYILSFIIVFLTTQRVGAILGSALFGSFVTWREQVHSSALVQSLTSGDPIVSQRIGQLAGAYGSAISDSAVRKAEGVVLFASQVRKEAYVLAYNDAFRFLSLLACVALLVLIIDVAFEKYEHKRAAAEGLAAT